MESPTTIIAIVVSISALFGYIVKLSWPYFLRRLEEKDAYIQKVTAQFLEATNHKTTEFTKAINDLRSAQEKGNSALLAQTEIFKQLIHDRDLK